MPLPRRKLLVIAAVGAVLLGLATTLRSWLGIEFDVNSVRDFAESLGPAGPLLFVGVVAGRSLLALPSQVVLLAAGLCFGTGLGTLVGGAGLMISGLGFFYATRYTGREAVERRIGPRLGRVLDVAGHRAGATAIAVGTGYPISPLSAFHAAAGLTSMSVAMFASAAFAGGAIRAALFAYFGNALTEANALGMILATVALSLVLVSPLAFPSGRAWVRQVFGPAPEAAAALKRADRP